MQIGGAVAQARSWSLDDLKRLPARRIDETRTVGEGVAREEHARRHAGVLLRDLLDQAGLVESARHDLRRSVVVATASDGYVAVFSWAELYLSPIGDGVLVVVERDGKPLDDREGPIALLSLKDTRTGPRHVKWLQRIEVQRIGR